jgi:cytochrome c551
LVKRFKKNLILFLLIIKVLKLRLNYTKHKKLRNNTIHLENTSGGFIMMRLLTISALAFIFIFLAGCSANINNDMSNADGKTLYNKSCLACHGEKLEGGPSGPPLTDTKNNMSEAEIVKTIVNGVQMMPAKLLTEEQAQVVAKWMVENK